MVAFDHRITVLIPLLLWVLASVHSFALASPHSFHDLYTDRFHSGLTGRHRRHHNKPLVVRQQGNSTEERVANITPQELAAARKIVKDAIAKATAANIRRIANPRRNNYKLHPGSKLHKRGDLPPGTNPAPPLFNVTEKIADAAALLAEYDALAEDPTSDLNTTLPLVNVTKRADGYDWIDDLHGRERKLVKRAGGWWMGSKQHRGTWPWGDDKNYEVFRDVTDPKWGTDGAAPCVADGKTDCTKAINNAMQAGKRCGEKCNGSTTKQAILYFPSGTYLVSGTIEIYFGTQMIGDASNPPVIKAANSFVGLGVFSTDHYVGDGDGADGKDNEWYINTANFYRQIRNFRFDIRKIEAGENVCAIHYQVGQATSLANIDIVMAPGSKQRGIFNENGSGGHMSDITFTGGECGLFGGSQQFTSQRMSFKNCKTAVQIIWDWGWTWKSIKISGGEVGFKLLSEDGVHHTGSLMVMDSSFENVGTAILSFPASSDPKTGTTGITLDNVAFKSVGTGIADNAGKSYLKGGSTSINTWMLGPAYLKPSKRDFFFDRAIVTDRISSLTSDPVMKDMTLPVPAFFEKKKPQYEDAAWSSFVSVKSQGAKGDGSTDDTAALQKTINGAGNSIVYIDAGTYLITDTITIPKGARIVGEAWAQLAASGSNFGDATNPRPMLKVGNSGEVGSVEMQDLLFTTKGGTAGVVLVEWNIKADSQGSAGMWDCHVRIGGAAGTGLESKDCPADKGGINNGCRAGSLMMHVTPSGSGYFENVWLWVADHDIDDRALDDGKNDMPMCGVYVARGLLVESTAATWMYGTASEHAVLYQYNFYKAKNVFAGMIQTESPYYQPNPKPPAPFGKSLGVFPNDPDYSACSKDKTAPGCDESWAVMISKSKDIFIAGAGLYSWFSNYDQSTCVDASNCQKALLFLDKNYGGIDIHNLITIGAEIMIVSDGGAKITSKDNLAVDYKPFWSQVTVFSAQVNDPPARKCVNADRSKPKAGVDTEGVWAPGYGQWPKPISGGPRDGWQPPGNQDNQGYFTLVNGLPYDWKQSYKHQYQMDTWAPTGGVPSMESVQSEYKFTQRGTATGDDGAEAYYDLTEASGERRQVKVKAHGKNISDKDLWVELDGINLKGSDTKTIDLPRRAYNHFGLGHRSTPFILTGSEEYGYYSSSNLPIGWMGAFMDIIGERKLKHVVMPGSHDAGMWNKDNGATALVDDDNVLTQVLSIYNQLRVGSRYFDIRPVIANADGGYYCGHYTDTKDDFPKDTANDFGANGPRISEVIDDVNKFMKEHPEEVVILYVSHDKDTNAFWNPGWKQYPKFSSAQWLKLIGIFQKINNLCKNISGAITDMKINDMKGCVWVITDTDAWEYGHAPKLGVYAAHEHFSQHGWGRYSDDTDRSRVARDQIERLQHRDVSSGSNSDLFYVMSWTLTIDSGHVGYGGIIDWNLDYAYDTLFWYAYHQITPYSFPSVILVDGIGFGSTAEYKDLGVSKQDQRYAASNMDVAAMAVALNLAVVSKNCYVGGGSIWPGEGTPKD